jgi:hypothetical protein
MDEFKDGEIASHVYTAEGYDGVIALLENIRTTTFPCLVIEDRSMGNISIDAGPLDTYSIPLWVMVSDQTKGATELYSHAFDLVKKILKILIRDSDKNIIPGLDYTRIPYNKRSGVDAYGYEILLTFRLDIDLSL